MDNKIYLTDEGLEEFKNEINNLKVKLSKIQKSASDEIETSITEYMMREKKKYGLNSYN